jgi:hypothetical protein
VVILAEMVTHGGVDIDFGGADIINYQFLLSFAPWEVKGHKGTPWWWQGPVPF